MRYAIVSDIHANLPAWTSVLADIGDMKVDTIICLGDVVGYGPDPVEVMDSIYRRVHVTLLGNHDAALCGKIDAGLFSSRAQQAVLRHREQLSSKGAAWLSSRPLVLAGPGFRCTHGDFSAPAAFRYVIDPSEAMPSWSATSEQLLFVGHTHLPGIYVLGASGQPHFVQPRDFMLEEGKRYIINPGSVGYPRVGDGRSSYFIFDSREKSITFRSIPFDAEGYRKSVLAAGMEDDPWLVQSTARSNVPVLRERLSFAQPLTASQQAKNVQQQTTLHPLLTRRKLAGLLVLLAAASGGAVLAAFSIGRRISRAPLALRTPAFDPPPLLAFPLSPPDRNLLPEIPASPEADGSLKGWRFAVEDRTRQQVGVGLRDGALTVRATHDGPMDFELDSPLIDLAGTGLRAVRLAGRVYRLERFAGTAHFQLISYVAGADGRPHADTTESFEARDAKRGDASVAALSRKVELSRKATHVRLRVSARFTGVMELGRLSLCGEAARDAAPTKGKASKP